MSNTPANKKSVFYWTFYDWANSAYPLVITSAIFPIFYENVTSIKQDGKIISDFVTLFGRQFKNTELYSYTISLSFLIVSLLLPVLSGIADYSGSKKKFMQFFCILGSFSTAFLYFFSADHLFLGMLTILMASVGFWSSLVFYNAFLPEIASPDLQDKVSARGFAMGYAGSAILLIINLILIQAAGMNARWSFVSVGIWWLGFAQITFRGLPAEKRSEKEHAQLVTKGLRELIKVWKDLKHNPTIKNYLTAFFVYSMGVQTVMLMAVLFAKKEIPGLTDTNLIISVLLIQFLGIAGSFLFSKLSAILGNIRALLVALFIWTCICTGTYAFVYAPFQFYVIAALVGLVMGGIQSLSRSTYAKLLPVTEDHASYFSFFDVCEKVGIIIGTFSFGLIEGITGGMRNSVLAIIVFFIVGFLLLLRVPNTKKLQSRDA
jgi:UMF1 family MFS transporter